MPKEYLGHQKMTTFSIPRVAKLSDIFQHTLYDESSSVLHVSMVK